MVLCVSAALLVSSVHAYAWNVNIGRGRVSVGYPGGHFSVGNGRVSVSGRDGGFSAGPNQFSIRGGGNSVNVYTGGRGRGNCPRYYEPPYYKPAPPPPHHGRPHDYNDDYHYRPRGHAPYGPSSPYF